MRKKSLLVLAICAAFAGTSVNVAFAGEITGNGKPTGAPEHARSICAFSGQNDEFVEGDENAPRTQSYGQLVSSGVIQNPSMFNPGDACNPNAGEH